MKCYRITNEYIDLKLAMMPQVMRGPTLDVNPLDRLQIPRNYTLAEIRLYSKACQEMYLGNPREENDVIRKLILAGREYVKVITIFLRIKLNLLSELVLLYFN